MLRSDGASRPAQPPVNVEKQTMEHCLVCPLLPNTCSSKDLAVFNKNAKDCVKQWETAIQYHTQWWESSLSTWTSSVHSSQILKWTSSVNISSFQIIIIIWSSQLQNIISSPHRTTDSNYFISLTLKLCVRFHFHIQFLILIQPGFTFALKGQPSPICSDCNTALGLYVTLALSHLPGIDSRRKHTQRLTCWATLDTGLLVCFSPGSL